MNQQSSIRQIPKAVLDKILQIHQEYPGIAKNDMLQKMVEDKSIRLQKSVIQKLIRQFYDIKSLTDKKKQVINLQSIPEPKKKIKPTYQFEHYPIQQHSFKKFGGIQHIVQKIEKNIFTPLRFEKIKLPTGFEPPKGFLLVGCMGSGKSSLGLGVLYQIKQIDPTFNTFYADYTQLINNPQQSLKKLFTSASQVQPSIIFIDGLDDLCSKENKKQLRPVDYLIRELDQIKSKKIYCLASASAPDKVDSSLLREGRLSIQIVIQHPNEQIRKQMLSTLLNNKINIDIDNLVSLTAGFVAADLKMLLNLVSIEHYQRLKLQKSEQDVPINQQDFIKALSVYTPLAKKEGFTSIPDVTLDDVGALTKIKQKMERSILLPIKQPQRYRKMNIETKAGILLYGPPGCGKTLIAKAIANAAKANFIAVQGPQILSKYVGDSEQAIRRVFQRAKLSAPCIIFFDEFDALVPKRQDQGNQVMERVVNTLLVQLNGIQNRNNIYVIAATNRPDILDNAILRSGRLQMKLQVSLPTADQRVDILKALVRKNKLQQNIKLQLIAKDERCNGFSGADLQFLFRQACSKAIWNDRDVLIQNDFIEALQDVVSVKYNKQ